MPVPALLVPLLAVTAQASLDPLDAQAILLIEAQRLPAEALERYISHTDTDTRVRAALALGRLRSGDALPALERLALDPEPRVRAEAAFALGQTPGSERSIVERLRDESDDAVVRDLITALGKQADKTGPRLLVDHLHTPGTFLRPSSSALAAAQALGVTALRDRDAVHRDEVIEGLLDTLDRFDMPTRRAAAFALARIRPEAIDPDLARRLIDAAQSQGDPESQAFLVRAASTLVGHDDALHAMLLETARDPDTGVRVATARAAVPARWRRVVDMLEDPNARVREVAIAAVGAMPDLDRINLLFPIVSAGDTLEAEEDLSTVGDPRLLDAVAALQAIARNDLLVDPAPWLAQRRPTRIRQAAITGVTDVSVLQKLALEDGEAPVRSSAAMRIAELEPGTAALVPLLDGFDSLVAAIGAEAMGLDPDAQGEGPLLDILVDAEDADLLAYGLGSLAAMYGGDTPVVKKPDPRALDLARTHIGHPHSRVRAACHGILEAAGKGVPSNWHYLNTVDLDEVGAITSARIRTDKGEFIIDLAPELAPLTVWNFARLADDGWYDGVTFHRIVSDFVVQTGDPRGDGTGGPEWTVPDEINRLSYDEGVVGMAHSGPDTAGSQWFVTLSPQPHLDGGYTAFGRVTQGMQVLRSLTPHDRVRRVTIERADDE